MKFRCEHGRTAHAAAKWVRPLIAAAMALSLVMAMPAWGLDPDLALTQYLQRIWQQPQGLPQAMINVIRQTQDGFLYLGTPTGLVRFDGAQFVAMDEVAGVPLRKLWICALADDSKHNLWVGTRSEGLIRLGNATATRYTQKDGLPSDSIHWLANDATGGLWIGTSNGLAYLADGKFTTYRAQDGLASNEARAGCVGTDGTVWAADDAGHVSAFRDGKFTTMALKSAPADALVQAMLCGAERDVWIGTTHGLVHLRETGAERCLTAADGLADNQVFSLAGGSAGTLWVGTKNGFSRYRNRQFESFRSSEGLSQSTVYTLFEDREGSLWVGTKHGLNQFMVRRTTPYTRSEGLASNNTGAVFQDQSGNIWVGTMEAGLSHFDGRFFSGLTSKQGLAGNSVYAMADDGQGNLWVGTSGGLNHLTGRRVDQTITTQQGLPSDLIRCLARDRDGRLWIGTLHGVAYLQDGQCHVPGGSPAGSSAAVTALIARRDGSVVIAAGNALYVCERDQLRELSPGGPPTRNVDAFYEDQDGQLWIGTLGNGLRLLQGDRAIAFGTADGLFDEDIHGIACDDQDRLWFACSKGIFFVSRGDLLSFAQGRTKSFTSTPFSPTDSLRTVECKSGVSPAVWRMNDGRLWFATFHGVMVIDPKRLQRPAPPLPVVIDEVIVDGKRERPEKIQDLPAGLKNLEFRYTGLSFLMPSRITFRYKLEGFDKDWIDAGTRRQAFYTNLPPGNYCFRVLGTNVDGSSNEAANPAAFTLAPLFYQRAWFWPACAAGVALLVWMIYRRRVLHIREHMAIVLAERSRIARELHDTLMQGFAGIAMQMQALASRLPATSSERKTLDEVIRDAGAALSEARRSVAGLRQPRHDDSQLGDSIAQAVAQITESHNIRLKLRIQKHIQELPREAEYNLLRIAQEAVTNSIKHACANTIEVALSEKDGVVKLAVIDDGVGFVVPEHGAAEPGHYGLIGMKERAAQIGAELQIDSSPGQGARIHVRYVMKKTGGGAQPAAIARQDGDGTAEDRE